MRQHLPRTNARWLTLVLLTLAWTNCVPAQDATDPLFRLALDDQSPQPAEMPLWEQGTPNEKQLDDADSTSNRDEGYYQRWVTRIQTPTLTIYKPQGRDTGTAVVICPGGGYSGLALDKEGHDIARWFNSLGVTGVVLKYRVKDYGHPAPKQDVQRALRTIRHRADKLHIKSDRIGVMGFSAGGHLAATAGTHFDAGDPNAQDPIDRVSSRPDFLILVYPVISFRDEIGHSGSRANLLGNNPDPQLVQEYSNELRVTRETPRTFLVHSVDDPVKVENSLAFFRALKQHDVPVTFDVYGSGGHGYGLGVSGGEVTQWPAHCAAWLLEAGLLDL